jgi:glycosyltransferase involved in cell wall biosynthesis
MRQGSEPEISVIMPVYNGSAFLERSVGSICQQTFPDWELLAVDDGSTDGSYEHLCKWQRCDSRIRAFRLASNRGVSAARNHGLRQAAGRFIAYLDCDDEYYPDYLGCVHAHQGHADVLIFAYDVVRAASGPGSAAATRIDTCDPALHRASFMHSNMVGYLAVAHCRGLLDRVGLFDESMKVAEDWDLWKRFALANAYFLFRPDKSGRYYVRPDGLWQTHLRRCGTAAAGLGSGDQW